jgi:hypothetical protein
LNVRATAEIDEGTATVDGAALASHELVNVVQLVFAVGKHLLEVLFGDLQSIEALLLLEDARRPGVKRFPVGLSNNASMCISIGKSSTLAQDIPIRHGHVVEETLRSRGTMGKKTSIFTFTCLSQSVSTRVPEDLAGLGVAEGHKKNLAVLLKRAIQIPQLSINLSNNNIGAQVLGHVSQEGSWGGLVGFAGDRGGGISIANIQCNSDLGVRTGLGLFEVLLPELFE